MSPFLSCELGAQSYSFCHFDVDGAIACLEQLGLNTIEFCGEHLRPDPSSKELVHTRRRLEEEEIEPRCYGVVAFTGDHDANRLKFKFARELGVEVLTADPTPDAFPSLDRLTEEFGVAVAVHNHGPGSRYDKVADTLKALEGHSIMIGACVDTGHALRSGERPDEVIARLDVRLLSLHLKDWKIGGEEQVLGEGDMDLVEVARALRAVNFQGPVMLEYEKNPEHPVPDMKRGLENWRHACKSLP